MWIYKNKKVESYPKEAFGFIYKITCKTTGKFYIGSKGFFSITNPKISKKRANELYSGSGRKKKRERKITESNWREYMGSSKLLLADIQLLGKDNFNFEIIDFARNKSELLYLEGFYQYKYKCLTDMNCYNEWISLKVHRKNLIL